MPYYSDDDDDDFTCCSSSYIESESETEDQNNEPKTPPPKLPVDHLNTATMLEIYKYNHLKETKWFQNLESAWLYVYKQIDRSTDSWVLNSFETVANGLKQRWKNDQKGFTVAVYDKYKYKVFYEPEENEAVQEYHRRHYSQI